MQKTVVIFDRDLNRAFEHIVDVAVKANDTILWKVNKIEGQAGPHSKVSRLIEYYKAQTQPRTFWQKVKALFS